MGWAKFEVSWLVDWVNIKLEIHQVKFTCCDTVSNSRNSDRVSIPVTGIDSIVVIARKVEGVKQSDYPWSGQTESHFTLIVSLVVENYLDQCYFLWTDFSVQFIENSPVIRGDIVTFVLSFGAAVARAKCAVLRGKAILEEVDCECNGCQLFFFSFAEVLQIDNFLCVWFPTSWLP